VGAEPFNHHYFYGDKKMKKQSIILLFLLSSLFFCNVSFAGGNTLNKSDNSPWETFNLNLGVFFSAIDSSVGLGVNNIGIDIDIEEALGLDTSTTAFRIDALWRFTDNKRHRFDLSWFDINRDSSKTLSTEIEIGDEVYPVGTTLESTLNFKIFKGSYSYSFFQDDRFDFGVSIGLFVVPIEYDFKSTTGQQQEADSITAPLPVIGLRGDFAITPKVFLKSSIDLFYLEFDNYEGKIWDFQIALEYNMFKNVGFGLGFDHFEVDVGAEGDTDIPGVNFNGNINFLYTGVMIYTKIYF